MLSCYCSDREPAVLIGKPAAGTRATVVWGRTRAAHQREAIWAILPPAIAMGVKPPDANMRGVNLKTSKRDPSAATTGKQGGVCSVNDAPSERAERLRAANSVRNAAPGQRGVARSTNDFVQPVASCASSVSTSIMCSRRAAGNRVNPQQAGNFVKRKRHAALEETLRVLQEAQVLSEDQLQRKLQRPRSNARHRCEALAK
jgi:hypothetical protein